MANYKKQKEISFEEKLWETAEQLRGKVEVSNYKYIAIGLMFRKLISERYNFRRNELDQDTRDSRSDNYCVSEKDREYLLNLKDQYISKGVFYLKKVTGGQT
jgi:type I restriction enzyme M protein